MRSGILVSLALAFALGILPGSAFADEPAEEEPTGSTEVTVQQLEAPAEPSVDLDQTGAASLVIPLAGAVVGFAAFAIYRETRR